MDLGALLVHLLHDVSYQKNTLLVQERLRAAVLFCSEGSWWGAIQMRISDGNQ